MAIKSDWQFGCTQYASRTVASCNGPSQAMKKERVAPNVVSLLAASFMKTIHWENML